MRVKFGQYSDLSGNINQIFLFPEGEFLIFPEKTSQLRMLAVLTKLDVNEIVIDPGVSDPFAGLAAGTYTIEAFKKWVETADAPSL